jgi:hypothetical protein
MEFDDVKKNMQSINFCDDDKERFGGGTFA